MSLTGNNIPRNTRARMHARAPNTHTHDSPRKSSWLYYFYTYRQTCNKNRFVTPSLVTLFISRQVYSILCHLLCLESRYSLIYTKVRLVPKLYKCMSY